MVLLGNFEPKKKGGQSGKLGKGREGPPPGFPEPSPRASNPERTSAVRCTPFSCQVSLLL